MREKQLNLILLFCAITFDLFGKCSSPLFSGLLMSSHYSSPFHLICRGFFFPRHYANNRQSSIFVQTRIFGMSLSGGIPDRRIISGLTLYSAARYATLRLVTCAQITLLFLFFFFKCGGIII